MFAPPEVGFCQRILFTKSTLLKAHQGTNHYYTGSNELANSLPG